MISLPSATPAADYAPHRLHADERSWTETNCYIDLWIELLNALDFDPVPAGLCALAADHIGDQWEFLKYPHEDLRALYGIEVGELNVWRPVLEHVVDHLSEGRLLTVEADAWWLPDTAGVSYRHANVKTTIVPWRVDREARTMDYFHNAGLFTLSGEDFDHIFDLRPGGADAFLPPYIEVVRLPEARTIDVVARAVDVAYAHIARRPATDPAQRLIARVRADLPWLSEQGIDYFHEYAFGSIRQFGATAELAADAVQWLTDADAADLGTAAEQFREASQKAKSVQFQLARLSRGRAVDLNPGLDGMAQAWAAAMADVVRWHER